MAKLSAHGTELLRVERTREHTREQDDLTSWERDTRAYMSDGKVLVNRTVVFWPASYESKGRRHNYGWTVKGDVKPSLSPAGLWKMADSKGWTLSKGFRAESLSRREIRSEKQAAKRRKAAESRAKARLVKRGIAEDQIAVVDMNSVMKPPATDLESIANKAILRHAVSTAITCPKCGQILDVSDAVFFEFTNGDSVVICGDCDGETVRFDVSTRESVTRRECWKPLTSSVLDGRQL